MDSKALDDNSVGVNVKYGKEVRFALVIAIVRKLDGAIVGVRIPEFEYTERLSLLKGTG